MHLEHISLELILKAAFKKISFKKIGIHDWYIIIIIIIIFINCNWVVTRWQWLFYMYTNMKKSN